MMEKFVPRIMEIKKERKYKRKDWMKAERNLENAVDIESALDAVGGHDEILVDMIKIFIDDYPARVESLKKSIDKADGNEIRSCAHGIRGNLMQVMAYRASELAEQIEMMGMVSKISEAGELMNDFEDETERVVEALREFVEGRQTAERD